MACSPFTKSQILEIAEMLQEEYNRNMLSMAFIYDFAELIQDNTLIKRFSKRQFVEQVTFDDEEGY